MNKDYKPDSAEALEELKAKMQSISVSDVDKGRALKEYIDHFIDLQVYDTDKRAALGYHVEQVMKYFKDL